MKQGSGSVFIAPVNLCCPSNKQWWKSLADPNSWPLFYSITIGQQTNYKSHKPTTSKESWAGDAAFLTLICGLAADPDGFPAGPFCFTGVLLGFFAEISGLWESKETQTTFINKTFASMTSLRFRKQLKTPVCFTEMLIKHVNKYVYVKKGQEENKQNSVFVLKASQ